ncbi:hypothetical protein UA08_05686 [Talaromyces atroroseus]|uniref:Peptidase A1 domain-containing protein n=1 Tax=Talaromyces atroroseus TaxID=1441469 RepID=A0A225AWG3_TALAT|nr:hypothetical protein UA08_05686 [Talaromyces atroroseus]OKL58785.1 hypothetical protein UA08_05686 [Talaromyces atroroseus]
MGPEKGGTCAGRLGQGRTFFLFLSSTTSSTLGGCYTVGVLVMDDARQQSLLPAIRVASHSSITNSRCSVAQSVVVVDTHGKIMHLSQYVFPAAILSTGVDAFYPYIRSSGSSSSLTSRLVNRFYPYRLGSSANDDSLLTLPLKRRPTLSRRAYNYPVDMGSPATTPNSVTVDEDGNDFSYFFSMDFGSSNESMWMLFDTGGTNTWVFGTNCTVEACELHHTFGQDNSTTLKMSGDTFSVGYGSGTVSGLSGTDRVKIANFSLELTFGLANNASSDFVNYPMDGILGLGRSNSTTIGTSTVMETIAKDHLLQSNIVAVSLQRAVDNTTDGELTFGGVDTTKFEGSISYTSTSTSTDRWEIPLDDAVVGGTPLNFTGKSAIIDTGTTYIFLPPNDASALHALIPGSTAAGDNFEIPCSTNTTVQFTFSGVSYSVSSQDYVGSATNSSGTTCYSNIIGVQTLGPDDWLLGDTFMKNVYSVFDFDQNRIGFASRNGTAGTTDTSSGSASPNSAATGTSTGSTSSTTQVVSATQSRSTSGSATTLALPFLANIVTLAASLGLYSLFSL